MVILLTLEWCKGDKINLFTSAEGGRESRSSSSCVINTVSRPPKCNGTVYESSETTRQRLEHLTGRLQPLCWCALRSLGLSLLFPLTKERNIVPSVRIFFFVYKVTEGLRNLLWPSFLYEGTTQCYSCSGFCTPLPWWEQLTTLSTVYEPTGDHKTSTKVNREERRRRHPGKCLEMFLFILRTNSVSR